MTAAEKAMQLVDIYRYMLMNTDTDCGEEILCTMIAKKCALVAVDQMMLVLPFTDSNRSLNEYAIQMQKYLELVRHEIKRL
jgi:hypothetical protein